MKSVQVNIEAATGSGLMYNEENGVGTFAFPPVVEGAKPVLVTVRVINGAWQFFPDRSSGQARVLGALGLT